MANANKQDQADWSSLDDDILVKAHLKGDPRAFEVLFKKYREMVARLVYSVVKHESQVEDVVQDVFLLLHRNLAKFRGHSALKTWIYRITVNEALRNLSKNKRWVALPEGDLEPYQMSPVIVFFNQGDSPERVMIEGEQKEIIQNALGTLKPQHRIILNLYYLEDLNVQEISETLEIPEGSVKSRLFYAREALRKSLDTFLGRIQHKMGGTNVL